jgi:crotonobetainyl-CoA:carnitine CoA-transferase CaiB-like acyl-CoA transferase
MTGAHRVSDPPLVGVTVLDLSHFLAGPYAGATLADLGADVIKVEDPDRPDEARRVGPYFSHGPSDYFLSLNWGKRSIAIRLATPEGRAAFVQLARRADVVLDNFRPGVMDKLGLGSDALRAGNHRLITCSLSGFGSSGPRASRPGYDYTIQALSGVMSLTGDPDRAPGKAGISYVDHAGGLAAALGIAASLAARGTTGDGRHLDLSLYDVQVSMLTYLASWQLNAGHTPARVPSSAHPSIVPAQTFATADGYMSVFVGNDEMWSRLSRSLGHPALLDHRYSTNAGRFEHRGELVETLVRIFSDRPTDHWVATFDPMNVPCVPINPLDEALADEQVSARRLIADASNDAYGSYRHVRGPIPLADEAAARGAPELGQHTIEVLIEAGFGEHAVESLVASGAVLQHQPPVRPANGTY